MSNRIIAFGVIALATLALAGQAFAHAHLKASIPADKSTVSSAPPALLLNFTEGLNLKFSGIKVTGPDNQAVTLGDAALTDHDTGLTVPVTGALAAGTYMVEWHALSTDGHKTTGSYSFTVKP
jgi:methionine-rich copper-binding protein CopC